METRTCFDLTTAIANWRQELASQSNLTEDNRRELEAHLRDTLAELQRLGLNNEESFWLACRRLGQPKKLGEEFERADPARFWRERVFWMALAFLVVNLWGTVSSALRIDPRYFGRSRLADILPDWVLFYLPNWLREFPGYPLPVIVHSFIYSIPLLCFAVFLASGRLKGRSVLWNSIFQSRRRFVFVGLMAVLVLDCVSWLLFNLTGTNQAHVSVSGFFFNNVSWTFPLIGLIAWLIPAQPQKIPQRA